jgi:hypothetical protein
MESMEAAVSVERLVFVLVIESAEAAVSVDWLALALAPWLVLRLEGK